MAQGKQTVTDDQIVREMLRIGEPAFTTAELAERFEMTTEGVRGRLEGLESDGRVCRKKPTKRTVLWWPAPEEA